MSDKRNNKEIIQKVIDAVEHPNNPDRVNGIAAHESWTQKNRQGKIILGLILNLITLVLLVIMLLNAWQQNSASQSPWTSLIFGSVMGLIFCMVAEKGKAHNREVLSPTAILVGSILLIGMSLLVSQAKQMISLSVMATIAIIVFSFLTIIFGYTVLILLRKLKSSRNDAS